MLSRVLGPRIELGLPMGKGILSPAFPPNRQRQRGIRNASTCTEVHGHPKSCYHGHYHGGSSSLSHLSAGK